MSAFASLSPEAKAAFIAEHGRLPRDISHHAFDPFRRRVLKAPTSLLIAQRIASIVLIPTRLLLAIVAIPVSYLLVVIFGPPVTPALIASFSVAQLPPWRRRIVAFANKLVGRTLLLGLGFWRVQGADHPEYDVEAAERATILSNHSSLADPGLMTYLHAPAFVAKVNVYHLPLIGRVGAAQHAFYFDRMRGSGTSVTERIVERQKMAAEGLCPPVAIYPEGTTTNGEHLLKFRTGGFVGGMPVAPILIRYPHRWFSPAYETIRTPKYVYGLLSQFVNRIEYWRMPVYYPNEEEKKDARLYADNVQKRMMSEFKEVFGTELTASDSNYIDKLEYHMLVRGTQLKKGLQLNKPA